MGKETKFELKGKKQTPEEEPVKRRRKESKLRIAVDALIKVKLATNDLFVLNLAEDALERIGYESNNDN